MEQCCYKPKFQVGDIIKYELDSFVTLVRQIIDTEDECYVAKLIFVKNHDAIACHRLDKGYLFCRLARESREFHEMIRECYKRD